MLMIKGTWITSKYEDVLYRARRTKSIRVYLFDSVLWHSHGRVHKKLTDTKKIQTCKTMHGWLRLPTGHMRQHTTGINQCPGCDCTDGTIQHLFQYTNQQMVTKRNEMLQQLHKKGLKGKVPKHILKASCHVIEAECNGKADCIKRAYDKQVKEAIWQQQRIGVTLILRGFLGKGWMEALEDLGIAHTKRRMNMLQGLIWDTVI